MTAQSITPTSDRFLDLRRPCRSCGTRAYTTRELNLHPGQVFTCYACFDKQRQEANQ